MNLKRFLPDVIAIAAFFLISVFYFLGPIQDGKVLAGHDNDAAKGSSVEMEAYRQSHDGERTRWTNTLFSGMPTYQMSPSYPSSDKMVTVQKFYELGFASWAEYAGYVFMMLLGFYILLRAFNFKTWMAALGAILWAFSSYYFIIIAAGHIWKLLTLCFIPPTIAGMVLCYRGKYLPGLFVTALFTALQILSNHIQMTYYFLFVMAFMALAYLIEAVRKKTLKSWGIASACALCGVLLGVCVNLSNLYHTYEYSKETMRSKSELVSETKENQANETKDGLDRDYITQWSYGKSETWTLLVPNVKGGASNKGDQYMSLSKSETAMEKADKQYTELYEYFPQYFGEQPGTSGPVYVGAFVMFLFVLGLFIVRGPMKWCLLAVTVLSILLSWGKNFMGFTDFFLDNVPMYDKFRTVASILVIAEFTIPLLAMMALKKVFDTPNFFKQKETILGTKKEVRNDVFVYVSLALTAGACLLMWMSPSIFSGDCISNTMDSGTISQLDQIMPADQKAKFLASVTSMRQAMISADAMRSFFIIMIGFGGLWLWNWASKDEDKKKAWSYIVASGLIILCLVDLWSVNRRYLDDDNFQKPRTAQDYIMRDVDKAICQDQDPDYRVLDVSNGVSTTFNSNENSRYHKSIGGYHAAKLRRYQELIDHHIGMEASMIYEYVHGEFNSLEVFGKEDCEKYFPVLNMLNTKYLIVGKEFVNQQQQRVKVPEVVLNPYANGYAWMADVKYVDNANQEMDALGTENLKQTAVANKQFKTILGESTGVADTTATIRMTSYEANKLTYHVSTKNGGVMVMSEIYYPGWTCTVDGKKTDIARVDYVLRAIKLDAGEHEVVMTFDPQSVHTTETIANIAFWLIKLLLMGIVAREVITYRKQRAQ